MALTKERIEAIAESANVGFDFMIDHANMAELCRLALLGLERDARAERIGRAVLAQEGDETPRDLRGRAVLAERIGYESYGALLRAIADAMEEP